VLIQFQFFLFLSQVSWSNTFLGEPHISSPRFTRRGRPPEPSPSHRHPRPHCQRQERPRAGARARAGPGVLAAQAAEVERGLGAQSIGGLDV
jgi:hypothetical protein